jgi:5-(carboxyamino)imidazole ribonucleotide synthase
MINEIAPRPHNSGHLTMEAFSCGQFEQQLRAVCDLPLVEADQFRPAAMVNLLGDLWFSNQQHASDDEVDTDIGPESKNSPRWSRVLEAKGVFLHLYGKATARQGRKMGHVTVIDETAELAATRALALRQELGGQSKS